MIPTCHIVVVVISISRSDIDFAFSKKRNGLPAVDGRYDFDTKQPMSVSWNDRPDDADVFERDKRMITLTIDDHWHICFNLSTIVNNWLSKYSSGLRSL